MRGSTAAAWVLYEPDTTHVQESIEMAKNNNQLPNHGVSDDLPDPQCRMSFGLA